MNQNIMTDIADYIAAYDRYYSSVENKSLTRQLVKVYNELLDIAERNAEDYDKFLKEFAEKNIEERFSAAILKCKGEFNRHI